MSIDMYAEEIISHYEHPHNKGKINDPSVLFHELNPVCGDDITVYLNIKDGAVSEAKFSGEGCAISIGAASMLTDELRGKKISDVSAMGPKDVIKMLGIDPGPARLKCATLSLVAVQKAIKTYKG